MARLRAARSWCPRRLSRRRMAGWARGTARDPPPPCGSPLRDGVHKVVSAETGARLAHAARAAFISGCGLRLVTAAAVTLAGCLLAAIVLPARPQADNHRSTPAPQHRRN